MSSADGKQHANLPAKAPPTRESMRTFLMTADRANNSDEVGLISSDACMWVFGYGSLIWKLSEDHRGIPGAPGRVVTLVEADDKEEKVWGVAYKIAEEDVESVNSHLDYREKGGYSRVTTLFYPSAITASVDVKPFPIFLYIGLRENNMYSESSELEEIAMQIYRSVGPSGANYEYLFNLADSLRTLCPGVNGDDHVFMLEKIVRRIRGGNKLTPIESVKETVVKSEVPGASSDLSNN